MSEAPKSVHLAPVQDESFHRNDLENRVDKLESNFEYGGRVWTLEQYKTFLAGIWCAAMLAGGLIWYLVERVMENIKK